MIVREGHMYLAKALDYDVATEGTTDEGALNTFIAALKFYLDSNMLDKDSMDGRRYRILFNMDTTREERVLEHKGKNITLEIARV